MRVYLGTVDAIDDVSVFLRLYDMAGLSNARFRLGHEQGDSAS